MRFLVDAQLPPALARRLEEWGHVAEHVVDVGMTAAPDHRIREYAAAVGACIVTKDEDFAVWRLLHHGPAVVWLRVGNTRVAPWCSPGWKPSSRRSSARWRGATN